MSSRYLGTQILESLLASGHEGQVMPTPGKLSRKSGADP
jgi:hypothetical protein